MQLLLLCISILNQFLYNEIIENALDIYIYTAVHSIYIKTVSSWRLLSTLMNQIELVYVPFGHSLLDFCPRPARKETYIPLRYAREAKCLLS